MKSIYSPSYAAVIEHLRELRIDAGMSQQSVAEKLGRPQSFVAKIESCERRLDVVEFVAFCRALDRMPLEVFKTLSKSVGW